MVSVSGVKDTVYNRWGCDARGRGRKTRRRQGTSFDPPARRKRNQKEVRVSALTAPFPRDLGAQMHRHRPPSRSRSSTLSLYPSCSPRELDWAYKPKLNWGRGFLVEGKSLMGPLRRARTAPMGCAAAHPNRATRHSTPSADTERKPIFVSAVSWPSNG